jgi:aminotransferase
LLAGAWSGQGFRDPEQAERWRETATGWVVDYLAGPACPSEQPVGVERTVALRTEVAALSGRADRIDRRGEELVVVDYKTGRRPPTDEDARTSVALALYAAAAEATLRRPCSTVELHHLPTGRVVAHRYRPGARDRQVRRLEQLALDIGSAERAGRFPPSPGPACSWCDLRAHCPEGRAAAPGRAPWDGLAEPGTGFGRTVIPMRATVRQSSAKAATFTESVIREMTRLALAHDAVNLAQGFPDFPCPPQLKAAACAAIDGDVNQYAVTWGAPAFRAAIAAKVAATYPGWEIDPDREVCVTCGSTEAMIATLLALVDPGEEVVVFEPFYENYGPDAILAGATPRYVTLHPPDWHIDESELRAAFTSRTRAVIVNTPHNPTGKVFSRHELELIGELCQDTGAICITDEIYEHIHYLGEGGHVPPATIPALAERTVTVNALSKTYAVTGWRVGWTLAPPELTGAIRKVHDFLTVGAPAPLQAAGVAAMQLPPEYYARVAQDYRARRDLLCAALAGVGFEVHVPDGAYYTLCGTSALDPDGDDVAFARRLVADVGIAAVPGSSFLSDPAAGRRMIRFAFPKRLETLQAAAERLARLSPGGVPGHR